MASFGVLVFIHSNVSDQSSFIATFDPPVSNVGGPLFAFVVGIVVLLITPTLTPVYGNWTNANRGPPTLLTGGSNVAINDDWSETFEWIKTNTPKDAIIGSWWDYGYWLTTMTDRISLADNGTLSTLQIAKIGRTLVSDPDEAWRVLTDWDVDYFMIFIAAQKLQGTPPLYLLNGGGDESKKVWFIRIGGEDLHRYTYSDGFSGTDYFWEDTLLGSMIPFSISTYYNQQTGDQSPTYRTGYVGIYHKDIKYPSNGDGPLKLAYASESFVEDHNGITAVLIYEVNKDYVPSDPKLNLDQDVARVTTGLGQFTIQLDRDAAPNTVQNFVNLTESGFYDNTIFHRIIPDYILQGGDPNTKYQGRDSWGFGSPGYSIDAERNVLNVPLSARLILSASWLTNNHNPTMIRLWRLLECWFLSIQMFLTNRRLLPRLIRL